METPLSPLDFARRTRRLHADREAVVDGDLRLTYRQFFDRCDRWSSVLQGLGVAQGDRVATISPNTHAQLECFYAVPQLGAVLVPINYRLTAEDFAYIVNHSGATVLCVAGEYLAAVDGIRDRMPGVRHYVALDGDAPGGWLDYEAAIAAADPGYVRPQIGERDLISINYTSGTTARPKGVMITHRNAAVNTIGTLLHLPMSVGSRYLWTLPMFHANGWTYTWTVTAAAGTHVCLRKVDPATIFGLIRDEQVSWLCAAPTVLIALASAPASVRGEVPSGVHVVTAGAPPAAATIERMEGEFGWEVTQVYGLTETAPFITVCAPLPEHEDLPSADRAVIKARQGVELLTSGEVEGTLLRHPAVQEVAIVGLPDEKWGETPHAFVVLRDGASATEAELITFVRERLAHFKAPRGVTLVDELPKTATGKIQKFVLRKGAPNLAHQ